MITAQIRNSLAGEPCRSFVDGTTVQVCLPENGPVALCLNLQRPAYVRVQSDGEELGFLPVDPTTGTIDLANLLTRSQPAKASLNLLALFPVLNLHQPRRTVRRVREFTVAVSKDAGGREVEATFNFHLMPAEDFEQAYSHHLRCRRRKDPSSCAPCFRCEEQPCCWNCQHQPVQSPCPCCGAEQEEE